MADFCARDFTLSPVRTVNQMQRSIIWMALPIPQRDYLLLSFISLFFFFPLGIPAIIFCFKTREANFLRDQAKAQFYSRLAFGFSVSGILVGFVVLFVLLTYLMILRLL